MTQKSYDDELYTIIEKGAIGAHVDIRVREEYDDLINSNHGLIVTIVGITVMNAIILGALVFR